MLTLVEHFGFHEEAAADGFASLAREDAGMNVVFLRRGLESLPEDQRNDHATGLILAFVVDEAHRMSAHYFGAELKTTKRYELGKLLGGVTRHLLLMTATPHAGKQEDFQLFLGKHSVIP